LDKAQLLMGKLLKQSYIAIRLKSLLQKCYGHHHNVVDHYEISISPITMDLLFFMQMVLPSITAKFFAGLACI
jgi:hypothetical protein